MKKSWAVRCDDYTSLHRTQAEAENHKHWVEQAGRCRLPHEVTPNPAKAADNEQGEQDG